MKTNTDENRRRFLAFFSSAGLGSTLLPGVLWAEMHKMTPNLNA